MASGSSKRARAAAQRGGADPSRAKGFLERLGQNRTARKIAGPALIAAGLTSQFQADQARDRKQMPPAAGLATPTSLSRNTPPTTRPSGAIDANGLRGAKPRPLSPMMDFGTRLASDQARDRHDAEDAGEYDSNATGELADEEAGAGQRAFLEGAPQSYASREKNEEQIEGARQASMLETGRQFFPGGVERTRQEGEPTRVRRGARPQDADEDDLASELQADQQQDRAKQSWLNEKKDEFSAGVRLGAKMLTESPMAVGTGMVTDALQGNSKDLDMFKKVTMRELIRDGIIGAETIVAPIISMLLTNLWTLNTRIFKKHKLLPPGSLIDDVTTGCLDCSCCMGCFFMVAIQLAPLALIAWAFNSKWDAFTSGVGSLFNGLFH